MLGSRKPLVNAWSLSVSNAVMSVAHCQMIGSRWLSWLHFTWDLVLITHLIPAGIGLSSVSSHLCDVNNRNVLLTVLKVGKSKIYMPADLMSHEGLLAL